MEQDSNEQHSIQEKDSGEETSKQDDGRFWKTRYYLGGRLKKSKTDHGFQKRDSVEDTDRKSDSSLHRCLFNGCFATCWEDSKADRRLQQCYDWFVWKARSAACFWNKLPADPTSVISSGWLCAVGGSQIARAGGDWGILCFVWMASNCFKNSGKLRWKDCSKALKRSLLFHACLLSTPWIVMWIINRIYLHNVLYWDTDHVCVRATPVAVAQFTAISQLKHPKQSS